MSVCGSDDSSQAASLCRLTGGPLQRQPVLREVDALLLLELVDQKLQRVVGKLSPPKNVLR